MAVNIARASPPVVAGGLLCRSPVAPETGTLMQNAIGF